jgi:NO-binding membrane sensor protein with MHYT domain
MTLAHAQSFLGCCTAVNFGILALWAFTLLVARDPVHRLHAAMFGLSVEDVAIVHYQAMAAFKMGTILLFATPWLVLSRCSG